MKSVRISPVVLVLCGGLIMGLSLGIRHVQGLFLLPMTMDRGWSREEFAFAFAVQNLLWGLAQPVAGMIADRLGSMRVLLAGCLIYGLGLYGMAHAPGSAGLTFWGGIVIGTGLAATTFGIVYGALSRLIAAERRGWALGLAGAVGGFGQFAMVPGTHALLGAFGWQASLLIMGAMIALAAPLAIALADKPVAAGPASGAGNQKLGAALREAFAHRGFCLLCIGFFACGFQLAFIAGHLPAYLADQGLSARSAVVALALIALANIAGTFLFGWWGGFHRRKNLLVWLYLTRAGLTAVFLLLPISELTLYAFAFGMGFLWLGTVPLTNGLISQIFGVQYISTLFGFVFVGHQLGSFIGVWLGGRVYDMTGSYDLLWLITVIVGVAAAALHWPIDDRRLARLQAA